MWYRPLLGEPFKSEAEVSLCQRLSEMIYDAEEMSSTLPTLKLMSGFTYTGAVRVKNASVNSVGDVCLFLSAFSVVQDPYDQELVPSLVEFTDDHSFA